MTVARAGLSDVSSCADLASMCTDEANGAAIQAVCPQTCGGCRGPPPTCLTPSEATAINKIWDGARNMDGELLWYGISRDAKIAGLGGPDPFPIPVDQARYWVYFDSDWQWESLTYENFEAFFDDTVRAIGDTALATDMADLSGLRDAGHKIIVWHAWSDHLIMPQGTIDYYNQATLTTEGGDVAKMQEFARLFMVPGAAHCQQNTG